MAFIEDTIGSWTPAQLQSFIQNIVSVEPSQIPRSLDFDGLSSGNASLNNLTVESQLSLSKQVKLYSDLKQFQKGMSIISDFYGYATPTYARDPSLAEAYFFQGDIRAQTFPHWIFDSTGNSLVNNTIQLNLIYIPITDTAPSFGYRVIQAEDQLNVAWHRVGFALYGGANGGGIVNWDDSVLYKIAQSIDFSSGNTTYWGQTGFKNIDWDSDPSPLEAGWYYIAYLSQWTTMGTTPQIQGKSVPGINDGYPNAVTTVGNPSMQLSWPNASGGFPSTIDLASTTPTADSHIFWAKLGDSS